MFSRVRSFFQSQPTTPERRSAKKSSTRGISKRNRQTDSTARFRAAEIESDDCGCDAVKAIQGRRFLVRDVPHLPVPDCDKPNCQCSYIRYNDRRNWMEDRRVYYSLKASHYIEGDNKERRKSISRRAADESVGAGLDLHDDFESWFK